MEKSLKRQKDGFPQFDYYGAPDDRYLEPLESISDWLLSSPDIEDWILQLRDASLSGFVPQYQL